MGEKKNNWNLQQMQESLVRDTERRIAEGFEDIAQNKNPIIPAAKNREPERKVSTAQPETSEPVQNINVPIPLSLHTRLMMLKAKRQADGNRQNIKQMVVLAIAAWLDDQERQ